jgi:hypothetical protein
MQTKVIQHARVMYVRTWAPRLLIASPMRTGIIASPAVVPIKKRVVESVSLQIYRF